MRLLLVWGKRDCTHLVRPRLLPARRTLLPVWMADQVGDRDGQETRLFTPSLPLIDISRKPFRKFPELLGRIRAQARHNSIEQQNKGNDGNHSAGYAGPSERSYKRCENKSHNGQQENEEDRQGMASRDLEDAHSLLRVHGILENRASFLRREMVEGSKKCPKSL